MVRERAASAIATLLTTATTAATSSLELREWIQNQPIETYAAYGLLPFLKAASLEVRFNSDFLRELFQAIRSPSLLSWLLFRELDADLAGQPQNWMLHSGPPPKDFQESPDFSNEVRYYLPHGYAHFAKWLADEPRIPFIRQWHYELKCLDGNIKHSEDKGLDYWRTLDHRHCGYGAADPIGTEKCHSAFLRTLAWAVKEAGLPLDVAIERAATSCPLDLELWKIAPIQRVEWWPKLSALESKIAAGDTEIWPQVEKLWEKQTRNLPFIANDTVGSEWIIAAATGYVGTAGATFHLDIYAGLQQSFGGTVPKDEDIVSALNGKTKSGFFLTVENASPLRLNGSIPLIPSSRCGVELADWHLLPLSCSVISEAIPRWQIWRCLRSSRTLANWFSHKKCNVEVRDGALLTIHQGKAIGRWIDWTDGLTEHTLQNAPQRSGEIFLVNRRWFEELCNHYQGHLVWGCEITVFEFADRRNAPRSLSVFKTFGGSRIIV